MSKQTLDLVNINEGNELVDYIWKGINNSQIPAYVLVTILETIKFQLLKEMTEKDD
jgi:hypothetical protein